MSVGARGYEHFNVHRFNNQGQNVLNIKQRHPSEQRIFDKNISNIDPHHSARDNLTSMMPYPRLIDILEHDDVAFPVPSNISTDHITDIVSPSVQLSTTRLPLSLMSPVAQMVTQARHQPSQNGVFPHQQGIISQQSGTASPILNYFMPAAEAHPLVIYVGMAAASAATGLLVARQSQIASDQPHDTNFPVHQHEPSLSSFPIHDDLGSHLEGMPIEQVLAQRLETPVEQPGFDIASTVFPVLAPSAMLYLRNINNNRNVNSHSLNPYELKPTHEISYGKNKMKKFIEKIQKEGIKEPIKYVEHNGEKYVVDGHHRLYAARYLGLETINVQKVELPYNDYKSTKDLIY